MNTAWVSDITYVPTSQGWLYLCVILDLASRRIIGWSMRETMHAEMVTTAIREALVSRKPAPGLIFHSDLGVQFTPSQEIVLKGGSYRDRLGGKSTAST